MTLIQIAERLKAAFPEKHTVFQAEARHFFHGELRGVLQIYHEDTSWAECTSLEDGIAKVRAKLAGMKPTPDSFVVQEAADDAPVEQATTNTCEGAF